MRTRGLNGMHVALACAGALVLLLVFGVSGGIAYLALTRDRPVPTETYAGRGYTFEYPTTFSAKKLDSSASASGAVLELIDGDRSITVYDYDSTLDARTDSAQQAELMQIYYEGGGKREDQPELNVDGATVYHVRLSGLYTPSNREQVQDLYEMPRDRGIIQISSVDASAEGRESVPEVQQILDSWHWER